MDPVQILLFAVVITLTVLLVVVGIQVFLILRETRRAIKKTNKLLEEAQDVLPIVKRPFTTAANIFEAIKSIKQAVETVASQGSSLFSRGGVRDVVETVLQGEEVPTRKRRKPLLSRPRFFKRPSRHLTS